MRYLKPKELYLCPMSEEYVDEDKVCKQCPYYRGSTWHERVWTVFCAFPEGHERSFIQEEGEAHQEELEETW